MIDPLVRLLNHVLETAKVRDWVVTSRTGAHPNLALAFSKVFRHGFRIDCVAAVFQEDKSAIQVTHTHKNNK